MYSPLQFQSKCALFLGGRYCLKYLTALLVRNESVDSPHKCNGCLRLPWWKEHIESGLIPLGVIGVDSELVIDELLHENEAGGTGGDVRVRTGMERQEVHLLSSQVLHL
jgi:hypothetical protein